jgi:hypothetical protein
MLEIYNDEIRDLLSINHVQLKMQILQSIILSTMAMETLMCLTLLLLP